MKPITICKNGQGNSFAAGDEITSTITLYAYDGAPGCEGESEVQITINPGPIINSYSPILACDSYILPAITGDNLTGNEAYFDQQNGQGTSYAAGDELTASISLYAFDGNANCSSEEELDITITPTPQLDTPQDVTACASFILPAISGTNLTGNEGYFELANGMGTSYAVGDAITTSQTVFIYDIENGCLAETSFEVTINPQPDIDPLGDQTACGDFEFPAISGTNLSNNAAYYTEQNGMGDQYFEGQIFSDVAGNYTFYIYDGTADCNDEETFQLTIVEPLSITNLNINCAPDNSEYNVDFQIQGGDPDCYEVDGFASSFLFFSTEIPNGDPYSFTITSDCAGCEELVISGVGNCACDTDAGTMDLSGGMLDLCVGETATATHNGDEFLETGAGEEDALQFVLHDNSGGILGTVYATNNTPTFAYDVSFPLNTTLYISAIAGDDDGNGNVDVSDNCLSVAPGVPVAWHELPTATISAHPDICVGEDINLEISFTGSAPFEFILSENMVEQTFNTNDNPFIYSTLAAEDVTFQVMNVIDAFCENTDDSNIDTITVASEISIENITFTCAPDLSWYIVEFDIVNGVEPYTIMGMPGTLSGNHFTGEMIANLDFHYYGVNDANNCNLVEVQGFHECMFSCAGATGEMDIPNPLDLCIGDTAVGTYHATNENLDGGILQFGIGEGSGVITDILAVNSIPEFAWDPNLLMTNTTYSIVAIVGPDDGTGNVDLDDPCTVISEGQLAYWHEPMANFTFADTTICANTCVDLVIEFEGVQDFDFVISENGQAQPSINTDQYSYTLNVCPNVTTTYEITQISNYVCPGVPAAPASVTVTIAPPLDFILLPITCLGNDNYQPSFVITGGVPPYTVTGDMGTLDPNTNVFTGGTYANDEVYSFTINDAQDCGPVEVTGTYNCACQTYSGTLDIPAEPLEVCIGDDIDFTFNGDNVLDGDDNFLFVLQAQDGINGYGPALAESFTPNFTPFQYAPVIVPGQTYYISAVAGNAQGASIDANDPCLSISQSIPVIFYQTPNVTLTGNASICSDECTDVVLDFTGTGPFDVELEIAGNIQNLQSPDNQLIVNICPADYGITDGDFDVLANIVSNAACTNNYGNNPPRVTIESNEPADGFVNQMLCPGDTLTIGNQDFYEGNENGIVMLQTPEGCDSTVFVSVSFDGLPTGDFEATLCAGDSIFVNGEWFSQSGTTIIPNGSFAGCDSMVNVIIDNYPEALGEFNPVLCPGGSINYFGTVFDEDNPEGDVILQNASQFVCDSIVHVTVSFNATATFTFDPTICASDTVTANATEYYFGNSTDTITIIGGSYLGCDSVIYVDLQFHPFEPGEFTGTFCEDDVVVVEGFEFTEFNPSDTLFIPNLGFNGCDSVIHVNLEFLPNTLTNLDMTLCEGEVFEINGTTFDENFPEGQVTFFGGAANGCDSAVYVTIEYLDAGMTEVVETIPAGTTIDIAGVTFSEDNPSGEVVILGGSWTGCDSTIIVTIYFDLVLEAFATSPECFGEANGFITIDTILGGERPFLITLDTGEQLEVNNFPYTINNLEAGIYSLIVSDANGKISFIDMDLPAPPEPLLELGSPITVQLGDDVNLMPITSYNPNTSTILWEPSTYLSCDTCMNTSVLQPLETTTYRLTLEDEQGCIISELVQVIVQKDREVYIPNIFSPNNDGVNDLFYIQAGDDVVNIEALEVFNRWGAKIFEYYNFAPNDSSIGWDGTYIGTPLDPQVFTYYAIVHFVDGRKEIMKGDVTLVR